MQNEYNEFQHIKLLALRTPLMGYTLIACMYDESDESDYPRPYSWPSEKANAKFVVDVEHAILCELIDSKIQATNLYFKKMSIFADTIAAIMEAPDEIVSNIQQLLTNEHVAKEIAK